MFRIPNAFLKSIMFSQNLHLSVVVLFLWKINELSEIAWDMSMTMMTSSNGNIFRVTGPLCGEFTGLGEFPTQRPVTRSFDVFFDVRLIKRLSKHSRGWWFETLSHPLWRHRNTYLGHNKSHDVLHQIGHMNVTATAVTGTPCLFTTFLSLASKTLQNFSLTGPLLEDSDSDGWKT